LVDGFTYWLKAKENPGASGHTEWLFPDPLEVGATKAAQSVFDELDRHMRSKRKAARDAGDDQGPYTRVWATAQKLALIRACGIKYDEPEITEEDAMWGCDLALLLTESFLAKVSECVAENKTECLCNQICMFVKQCGEEGAYKSQVTRKFQGAGGFGRRDAILTLVEGGRIREETVETKGRRATRYTACD
jgi:hypothetical protein